MVSFIDKIFKFWFFIDEAELYLKKMDDMEKTDKKEVNKEVNKKIIGFFNKNSGLLFFNEEENDDKCILETDIPSSFNINLPMIGDIEYKFPYKNHKIYNLLLYSHDYDIRDVENYQNTHYKKYTIDKLFDQMPSYVKFIINPVRIEDRLFAARRLLQDLCKISNEDIEDITKSTNSYPQQIKMVLENKPNNKSSIFSKITNETKDSNIDSKMNSKYISSSSNNDSLQIIDGKIKGEIQLASNIPNSLKIQLASNQKTKKLRFKKLNRTINRLMKKFISMKK